MLELRKYGADALTLNDFLDFLQRGGRPALLEKLVRPNLTSPVSQPAASSSGSREEIARRVITPQRRGSALVLLLSQGFRARSVRRDNRYSAFSEGRMLLQRDPADLQI